MLETVEDKKRFLASSEMCYDPMYQASMDSMWHHWMQEKWDKERRAYLKREKEKNKS